MQKNKKQKKNNFWMVFRTLHFSTLTSLPTWPTVHFDQPTENWSIAILIRLERRMLYPSKIHKIWYILLEKSPLKKPQNLKKKLTVVSLQTVHPTITIEVVPD